MRASTFRAATSRFAPLMGLLGSIPPQVTISRFLQRLKGKSSYKLLAEYSHLLKNFWGRHV